MKRLTPGLALLAAGGVMLALPIHMQTTGLVLLLLGAAAGAYGAIGPRTGPKLRAAATGWMMLGCVGVIVLMAGMSLVTCAGRTDWSQAERAEYALVLGASVREDGKPSRIMRGRVEAAWHLMERNPQVTLVLSGGQGGSEPISEARCMYQTLLDLGAEPGRLMLEDQSESTWENLENSLALIQARGGTDQPVALVTSEFHLRRAMFIASALGVESCPVAARTEQWFYRVNYTLREVFALVKARAQSAAWQQRDHSNLERAKKP